MSVLIKSGNSWKHDINSLFISKTLVISYGNMLNESIILLDEG